MRRPYPFRYASPPGKRAEQDPDFWRVRQPCDNCPFSDSEAGQFLRSTLEPGFIAKTEAELLRGGHFTCHKTVYTRYPSNRVCAGAVAWQAERGIVADVVQVMERLTRHFTAK